MRQTSSLIKRRKLYIGNETGLKHIAAALNVPIVEISSLSKWGSRARRYGPYRFTPWKAKYITVCPEKPISPCKYECISPKPHCILQVGVEEVKEAVRKLLAS